MGRLNRDAVIGASCRFLVHVRARDTSEPAVSDLEEDETHERVCTCEEQSPQLLALMRDCIYRQFRVMQATT